MNSRDRFHLLIFVLAQEIDAFEDNSIYLTGHYINSVIIFEV